MERAGHPARLSVQAAPPGLPRIGHADPAGTMQVYAHALEGDDSTAAETTAAAIFGP